MVELTVDRLPDGEVSPYLTEVLVPGDEVELRGPIGGYFAWRGESPAAGGRRVRGGAGDGDAALAPAVPAGRAGAAAVLGPLAGGAIFADELGEETTVVYTRRTPDGYAAPGRPDHRRRHRGGRLRRRPGLRVRLVRVRRGRGGAAGRRRLRPVPDPAGALRPVLRASRPGTRAAQPGPGSWPGGQPDDRGATAATRPARRVRGGHRVRRRGRRARAGDAGAAADRPVRRGDACRPTPR